MGRRTLIRGGSLAALAAIALYALLGGTDGEDAAEPQPQPPSASSAPAPSEEAALSDEEAAGVAQTLAAIESGELPFERDGSSFQNREGLLPAREDGYYREYTVITPGSEDRGARRLVIGAGGETYYTRDHYDSFVPIDSGALQ